MRILRIAAACALLGLAGCAHFQQDLEKVNSFANKYGPIIGKDLLMIANILVQAECSPALKAATWATSNVLTITAPTSSKAQTVKNVLATNLAVAAELCPLVASIKAQVGSIPAGEPTQVITLTK